MGTFGEKAVGVPFNPSKDSLVDDVKGKFADLINIAHAERSNSDISNDRARHYSLAITEMENAYMRFVKAITWQDEQ